MNEMNTTDRALSWDDEFTNEQQEFVLLPEGDYAFEVTGMERARFEGSAKLPPCSMAKLTLKIFGGAKGDTTVTHRLYLHTKTQGLMGAFFESIGQCKRGYFPEDMPIKDYPADFVEGCLIAAWPQVFQMELDNRDIPF